MKKLANKIAKFGEFSQIELTKWQRKILYEFLIDIIAEMYDCESLKND